MNSKFVTCLAMMLASYPIAYLFSFHLLGAILFSVVCAAFVGKVRLWKVCVIYFPLYFFLMFDSLLWMPQFLVNMAEVFGFPAFFCSLQTLSIYVFLEIVIVGLSKLFVAKAVLKKIGFYKRLGGLD